MKITYEARVARQLSAATGRKFTEQDLKDWTGEDGAGPAYNRVDKAVRTLLGDELYNAALQHARMCSVLGAVLDGKKITTIGGKLKTTGLI